MLKECLAYWSGGDILNQLFEVVSAKRHRKRALRTRETGINCATQKQLHHQSSVDGGIELYARPYQLIRNATKRPDIGREGVLALLNAYEKRMHVWVC